jgi:hypothetical protein
MKTATIKNTPQTPHTSIPFFNRSGEGSFFSQSQQVREPFFNSSTVQLQRKGEGNEQEEDTQKMGEEKIQMKQESVLESDQELDKNKVQAKSKTNSAPSTISNSIQADANTNDGKSLSGEIKSGMESAFGEDFSSVSIQKNSSKANELNALAFTQGENISFAPGQYDPGYQKGQELLGHELTHVVQQREGRVQPNTQAKMLPVNDDKGLEKEADDMGKRVAQQKPVSDTLIGQYKVNRLQETNAPLQFRLPTYANLESVFKDATLAVPESVVISMITTALTRMEKKGQLKSSDPVPVIVKKIFPAPGVIVQSEFEKAVDVTDRNQIYQTVLDTDAPVKAVNRSKLKSAMKWAVDICRLTPSMTTQLKRVFGSKVSEAKDIYKKAGDELDRLKGSDAAMDAGVNTDYNKDDPAMGLGGWASGGVMHLQGDIAEVKDSKKTVITLIHEGSHLANSAVSDAAGYYPPTTNPDAFSGETEENKIANAAHFEEFPRRWLAVSAYPKDTVFTPGAAVGGGPVSLEDKTRKAVSGYFTKAWDASVDVQFFLRDIQKNILNGIPEAIAFNAAKKAKAKDVSQRMDLSIHKQAAGKEKVTQLDIVLAEGVPMVAKTMRKESASLPVKVPLASDADIPAAAEQLIKDAIAGNKTLLNDPVRDKALLDWLVSKYHAFL